MVPLLHVLPKALHGGQQLGGQHAAARLKRTMLVEEEGLLLVSGASPRM